MGLLEKHTEHEGQGLVEYSLILLLIMIAVVATAALLGDAVIAAYEMALAAFP